MRIFAAIGLTLIKMALATAIAAPQSEYMAAYKRYNEALARDDQAAAAEHARAAWQAAEAELGDHKTTAALAYNYGQLVLFDDPAPALAALQRAAELQSKGKADLPTVELELYVAFARFKVGPTDRSKTHALRSALDRRRSTGALPTWESSEIWLALTSHYLSQREYGKTVESAGIAEAEILAVTPQNYKRRALAIVYSGIGRLTPVPRSDAAMQGAHEDFVRGIRLFPTQKDIETFDPLLGFIIAWDYATHSALFEKAGARAADRRMRGWHEEFESSLFAQATATPCQIEWKRTPPEYPKESLREGELGAVFAGYHISEDGRVTDQRVLGEVPRKIFGDAALKSMDDWVLLSPDAPAECRRNRTSIFLFTFKEAPGLTRRN